MKTPFRFVVVFLLLIGLIAGVAIGRLWFRAWSLERADVARDVERAVTRGDLRILGIKGAGLYLPGTDSALYAAATAGRCPFRIIYVGDAFSLDLQRRVAEASFRYATTYNRDLIARRGPAQLCTVR